MAAVAPNPTSDPGTRVGKEFRRTAILVVELLRFKTTAAPETAPPRHRAIKRRIMARSQQT